MEEKIAILMADLAGYTALTETHGAIGAANIIDKYLEIVKHSLVGGAKLHENTGDEVMIIADSASALLATAENILKNAAGKDHFLQVHGGLHYGQAIKRNNKYFGTAINLTARITAKASPGSFWCSADFIQALPQDSIPGIQFKGSYLFKNLRSSQEVFEIAVNDPHHSWIDPVCKMLILEKEQAITHPDKKHLLFCDSTCLDIYMQNSSLSLISQS